MALGAAAGEVLYALTGLIFGDPDITWQAVRQVLPAAVTYDLLISPFVLYAVVLAGGYARWGTDSAPAGLLSGRELAAAGAGLLAGGAGGAVRDTGAGRRSPRLRAAAGHRTDGWIGGSRDQPGKRAGAWVDRPRPLRLRLRGGTAGSAAARQAGNGKPARPLATVNLRLGTPRRRDGAVVARRYLAGATPGTAFDGRAPNSGGRSAPAARRRAVRRPVGPRPGTLAASSGSPGSSWAASAAGTPPPRQVRLSSCRAAAADAAVARSRVAPARARGAPRRVRRPRQSSGPAAASRRGTAHRGPAVPAPRRTVEACRAHARFPWSQPEAAGTQVAAKVLQARQGGIAMIPAARRRLVVLYAVVAVLLLSLGGRLWYLQVMTVGSYASAATQDQVRTVIVPPVRGQILDDTGQPLVNNHTSLVVSVNRALVSQQPGGGIPSWAGWRTCSAWGALLQQKIRLCTAGVSQPCWQGSPYQPIPVAQQVPAAVALQIMENQGDYPGVTAQAQPVTHYVQPYATAAAQMLGYLQPITPQEVAQRHLPVTGFSGVDLVGQAGLEEQYDRQLRGTPGTQTLTVNAAGTVTAIRKQASPKSGNTLVTSLNAQLQADTYNDLVNALHSAQAEGNTGATSGAAVVMTTTGRVVAMASYPTYDPSIWNGGISKREFKGLFGTAHGEPILNRATQGEYGPGSTFKVTSASAAVADGMSAAGPYTCPGSVTIAGHTFNNWTTANLGPMSLHTALVWSCDTVFYQIAYQMYLHDKYRANFQVNPHAPVQKMQNMELRFGFGRTPGIDLPEQSAGTIPTRQWLYNYWKQYKNYWCKHGNANGSYVQQIAYDDCRTGYQWTPGQAAIAAIGQGYVSVTPLQLARAYAAIANGGTLYSPRVGEALISPTGKVVQRIKPPVVGHLRLPHWWLSYLTNALEGVVTGGTAAGAFHGFPLNKVPIAAKTGTAEIFGGQATSVFASYAPASDPKYVVVVMVPKSGEGADVSAPAARQIWDSIYGLEGHKAAFPAGQAPRKLPVISASGAITAPPGYQGAP